MYLLTTTGTAQHFIQAFSWMLIHSLWQGLVLAVVTGFILMLTKRANAAVRYNLVFVQFLLFIIACTATFLWEWSHRPLQTAVPGLAGLKAASPLLPGFNAAGIKVFAHTCIAYFTANAPLIMLIWFVFFLFRSVRMMGSLVYIHRAKHHLVYQPANCS
jgi:bla regulator protein blaR1